MEEFLLFLPVVKMNHNLKLTPTQLLRKCQLLLSARPSPKKACSSPSTNNRATPVNIYPGTGAAGCSNPYARHVAQMFLYLEQDQATTYLEEERRQMLIHLAGCVKCKSKKKSLDYRLWFVKNVTLMK